MEEEKISFWKKVIISVKDLEKYQELAAQKIGKTIIYLLKIMAIFTTIMCIGLTYKFVIGINDVKQYIEENIDSIEFQNNILNIGSKDNPNEPIIINGDNLISGKVIINTNTINEDDINNYTEEIKYYSNGIVILKDRFILKTDMVSIPSIYLFSDIADKYNINKLEKQDIIGMLSDRNFYTICIVFFIVMFVYMFTIYLSTVLVDVIILSILGYITSKIAGLRLKYSAIYNIGVYAMTLPIILNIIYIMINMFTGFTIKYFQIMYTTISYIYVVASILMIKSDLIKKQIELNKIMEEQERVKEEIARKEQEKKEEEERERIRKEDEKKRKEDGQAEEPKEETTKKKKTRKEPKIGKEAEGSV